MEDPACNIGLASWYYFWNVTGNGGATNGDVVWIADYCSGGGIAGNMSAAQGRSAYGTCLSCVDARCALCVLLDCRRRRPLVAPD